MQLKKELSKQLSLGVEFTYDFNDFFDFICLLLFFITFQSSGNTGRHMVFHDVILYSSESSTDSSGLLQNIHAISLVFYHFDNTTDLTLYPPEAL